MTILEKRAVISRFIEQNPNLSNRAIAKLADVSPHTVASVRNRMELPLSTNRQEASGRMARGQKPVPSVAKFLSEVLPTVYRCYGKSPGGQAKPPLLYVGCSLRVLLRLATHEIQAPWYREIVTIRLTHYSTRRLAEAAEAQAIHRENPRYNIVKPVIPLIAETRERQRKRRLARRRPQ